MTIITCNEDNDNEEWWATFGNDRSAKMGVVNMLKAQSPEYRAKLRAANGQAVRTPDGVFESITAAAEHYGIHSVSMGERIRLHCDEYYFVDKGPQEKKAVRPLRKLSFEVMTPDGVFESITAAAKHYGIHSASMRERIHLHGDEYYYVSTGPQEKKAVRPLRKLSYKIQTPDGVFESIAAAAKHYGIHAQTMRERILRHPDIYSRVPSE